MGRSIRIYLADGTASGVRHAEIVNWTGQALAIPRGRVSELKSWPEARRQGVYFLIGESEQENRDAVYIGEAEVVAERIAQHLSGKEFWRECVVFTSKDDNLTKSHIKYLESRLVSLAVRAGRFVVMNTAAPTESGLPRSDRDAMDEFMSHVQTLLGVLGHRVLDPILPPEAKRPDAQAVPAPNAQPPKVNSSAMVGGEFFTLAVANVRARAIRDADALVVLRDSQATKETTPSLSAGYKAIRDRLIKDGSLVDAGTALAFTKDVPFPSASQAAAIIVGYSVNGRHTWKAADGRSLRDVEQAEAESISEKLSELTPEGSACPAPT